MIAVVVAMYAAFLTEYETITETQVYLAILIVVLGAIPSAVALIYRREAGLLPLMPLHGLFYALTFGLPIFSSKTVWRINDSDTLTYTLVLTIVGLISLYFGYYTFLAVTSKLNPVRLPYEVPPRSQIRIGWILLALYLLFQFVPILSTIPSVGQLVGPLSYLSIGILFLNALNNNLTKIYVVILTVAVIFIILSKTLTGSLAAPVFFILFLGIIYWNRKRAVPWQFILPIIFIAVFLNPVKQTYRSYTWIESATSQSYYDKAVLFIRAAEQYYSRGELIAAVSKDTSIINRLAHIATFEYVIATTPDQVPYWSGGSYQTLFTSFIPRMIWPDKPQALIGQEFGHRYKMLDALDKNTSLNLPWLPEFYANFGEIGVVIGMFLVGVLFRLLVQKFSAPVSSTIEYVLGVTIIFNLFYAESNFSLMVGGVFLTYAVFLLLLRLLTDGSRSRPFVGKQRLP